MRFYSFKKSLQGVLKKGSNEKKNFFGRYLNINHRFLWFQIPISRSFFSNYRHCLVLETPFPCHIFSKILKYRTESLQLPSTSKEYAHHHPPPPFFPTNPQLADIIIEKQHMLKNRYQIEKLTNRQSIHSLETDININNVNYTSHGCKDEEISKESKIDNTRTLPYWLCKNNHKLMNCKYFLAKTLVEKKNFVFHNKLYFNCSPKGHYCRPDFRCCEEIVTKNIIRYFTKNLKLEI